MASRTDINILGIFLLSLSIFFIIAGFVGFFHKQKHPNEYAMIVDIASDYIEFNLYKWENSRTKKRTASVKKVSTHTCELNANDADLNILEFKSNFFNCVHRLEAEINNFELNNATIFIYGTDYTRIFCDKHIDICQQVFWSVRDSVEAFDMVVDPTNTRPLRDTEEPLFGWVSVNDFFHTLDTPNKQQYNTLDIKNHTVSVSIYDNGHLAKPTNTVMSLTPIVIYGKKYNVYTQDYTCYGTEQAHIRLLLDLIKTQRSSSIVHPCMTNADSFKIKAATMWSKCVTLPNDTTFYESYNVAGKYDEKLCLKAVKAAFSTISSSAPHDMKNLQSALASSPNLFYAFSHVTLQSEWLNLKVGATLEDFKNAFPAVCGVKNSVNPLRERCFNVTYTYVLFTDGLGMDPTKVIIGNIKESIETLTGAMVYSSINIPARKLASFLGPVGFASVLFSAFTFLTFFVLLILRHSTLVSADAHERLRLTEKK